MFRYFLLGGDSAAPSGLYARLYNAFLVLRQMFNMSALLLDGAFKPATPMTNGVISETLRQFGPLSDISQGSVATHFMYGGIFSDGFIANYFS